MRDHFRVRRWEKPDEPRLTVLAIPAAPREPDLPLTYRGQVSPDQVAGQKAAWMAEAAQEWPERVANLPVTPIPPRWAHITIATLVPSANIPAAQRQALVAELDLAVRAAPKDQPICRSSRIGCSATPRPC